MDTYPGTDLLVRICYSADCQKRIDNLEDVWVDVDSNCCICTECREAARDEYDDDYTYILAIVPATDFIDQHAADIINEMQEG